MTEHVNSYYAASANPHAPYPTLTEQLECDVCVIGAGYTGLSSALHLVEKGYKVVVLEAAPMLMRAITYRPQVMLRSSGLAGLR